ncbi:D-arabinono-1,4-lactone oxidase [Paenarthrobacter sp. NPDC091669]|uniref:D-arabinono-1,4-lactone oxidase n=1 Tax=Paenarthrobacter sp. NPDC091669 TaxID=3364384 RepID=UPI0037F4F8CD
MLENFPGPPRTRPEAAEWNNWGQNQRFRPQEVRHPGTEIGVRDAVRSAISKGESVRAAGSGHSYTPVVETEHTLLDLRRISGIVSLDQAKRQAFVRSGTILADLGEPLWKAGYSLANQGDTHGQTLAGATATGTKGSGKRLGTLSSMIRGLRLVNGHGEIVDIDGTDPELLQSAQVSLGLLGIVTEITIEVVPAYRLQESNRIMGIDDLLADWDSAVEQYRHFSFFWSPRDASSEMYSLPPTPADHAWVKFLSEEPAENGDLKRPSIEGAWGNRNGRSYLIYPDITGEQSGEYVELEYMVDERHAKEAFLAVRDLMLTKYPDQSPVQVRWQQADSAFLSAQYQRDSVSISVSGSRAGDYDKFLRAVDAELRPFSARPHWGKMHYLGPEDVALLYPGLTRFLSIRDKFDPQGIFLNRHFKHLFRR